jgi:predicted RNase H-like HicB family nuclease
VQVETSEDGWLVAQAMEEPAAITQGRDLDEVGHMIRDATELLTQDSGSQIDLMAPASVMLPISAWAKFRRFP